MHVVWITERVPCLVTSPDVESFKGDTSEARGLGFQRFISSSDVEMVTKCQSNPTDKQIHVENLDSNAVYKIVAEHTGPCRADNVERRKRSRLT